LLLPLRIQKLKGFQLQGASPPPDQELCHWSPLGAPPQTPVIGSRSRNARGSSSGKSGPKDQVALHYYYKDRLRIGARLTRYRNCKFHYFARTISRYVDGISRYSVPPSAGPLLPLYKSLLSTCQRKNCKKLPRPCARLQTTEPDCNSEKVATLAPNHPIFCILHRHS